MPLFERKQLNNEEVIKVIDKLNNYSRMFYRFFNVYTCITAIVCIYMFFFVSYIVRYEYSFIIMPMIGLPYIVGMYYFGWYVCGNLSSMKNNWCKNVDEIILNELNSLWKKSMFQCSFFTAVFCILRYGDTFI